MGRLIIIVLERFICKRVRGSGGRLLMSLDEQMKYFKFNGNLSIEDRYAFVQSNRLRSDGRSGRRVICNPESSRLFLLYFFRCLLLFIRLNSFSVSGPYCNVRIASEYVSRNSFSGSLPLQSIDTQEHLEQQEQQEHPPQLESSSLSSMVGRVMGCYLDLWEIKNCLASSCFHALSRISMWIEGKNGFTVFQLNGISSVRVAANPCEGTCLTNEGV